MNPSSVIPQFFYDLIARLIPGALALAVFTFALDIRLGEVIDNLYAGSKQLQNSTFILSSTVILSAYLLGQFISQIGDLFERAITRVLPQFFNHFKAILFKKNQLYPENIRKFIITEMGYNPKTVKESDIPRQHYLTTIFLWYDWIRLNDPEAGARSTKIRAEYRMHSGIIVTMILTTILHISSCALTNQAINIHFIYIPLLIALLGLFALSRTYRIFQLNIINQYTAKRNNDKTSEKSQKNIKK